MKKVLNLMFIARLGRQNFRHLSFSGKKFAFTDEHDINLDKIESSGDKIMSGLFQNNFIIIIIIIFKLII